MLYTGKGDKGTTTAFGCDQQRISKSSELPEALGALDELNAFLGFVKIRSEKNTRIASVLHEIQEALFIVQAEIAGADKNVGESTVKEVEKVLIALNLEATSVKRVKPGRAKSRGRAVRYKKNPLVVVTKNCGVVKALGNIPGYDTIDIKSINAGLLTLRYGVPRPCIFTEGALEILNKERLFYGVKK